MARHYATRDFFWQMPNPLLARYFHARGVFDDLDMAALPEPQPDALWVAWLTLDDPQRHAMDGHVPGHHGAEWPRGARRQGPRLADRASSAGTVFKSTSSFTMRTDVAASDPPSDSARSPRRRPVRGARG